MHTYADAFSEMKVINVSDSTPISFGTLANNVHTPKFPHPFSHTFLPHIILTTSS